MPLSVVLSGRVAGTVAGDGLDASSRAGFSYDPEYLAWPDATPLSVSAPLRSGRHEVGAWLDGLLSDNHVVRERWRSEHQAATTRPVDLLASPVGRDCAGAVQFCPENELAATLQRDSGVRELTEGRVAEMVASLRMDEAAWSQGTADAAFSLAGAQSKTALRYEQGRWFQPYGDSPTTHILKPGISRFPDIEFIEHISQRAAVLLGIDAAETKCVEVNGQRALLVTRYDRLVKASGEYQRIHQEDACQALGVPPTQKYQNQQGPDVSDVAGLLWAHSSDPETDVRLFRDALIYNWLIVGPDAHAKNYSLLLDNDDVRMAPLYDVCSVLPYRDVLQREGTRPVRSLTLAMKIGRDYSIHKADCRRAWERTSHALSLRPQETLDRAVELAQGVPEAVEQAIEDTPRWVRASMYVARMNNEIKQRAAHCQHVQHMTSPSTYGFVSSLSTEPTPLAPSKKLSATRTRCSHVGARSAKRCRLSSGHRSPHRYSG